MIQNEPEGAGAPGWRLSVFIALIGGFMAILDSSIVNIAIPKIMAEFTASTDQAEWVVTIYLLTLGVVVPISGWLGDRMGYSRLYTLALAMFTLGSALCGFSWSIESLAAFRVLQALGGGLLMPLMMSMIYRMVPRDRIGSAMGVFGIAIVAAPAIGPTLGGYLVEYLNWRLIFYVNVPVGIAGVILSMTKLTRFAPMPTGRFDTWGLVTSVVGLFALLLGLSEGASWGWTSEAVELLLFTSLMSLALFVYLELTQPDPLLDLRVFRYRAFTISMLLTVTVTVGLFAGVFYIPLFLQTVRGLGALQTGLILLPAALVSAVMMPISGRLYDGLGPTVPVVVGLAVLAAATYLFHDLSLVTPTAVIAGWMVLRSVGMGFAMMPIQTAGMTVIPTKLISRASAVSNIVQRVAGSFGLAALTAMMTSQQAVSQAQISAAATPGALATPWRLDAIAGLLSHGVQGVAQAGQAAAQLVAGIAAETAFVGAVDQIFVIAALAAAVGIVLALFLRAPRARRSGPVPGAPEL